jgi:outer membrane biosynthesis protein TonB
MFKQFRDKVALSGITVLLIGVALLLFTFVSAYGFLTQGLSIIASEDLVRTFGEALAPLIATCIRIMYLGIMGWIGSLLTIRGITIIAHLPETSVATAQKTEAKQELQPQKMETGKPIKEPEEPEVQPSEPKFVVIPPEENSETASQKSQPEKSEPQPAS